MLYAQSENYRRRYIYRWRRSIGGRVVTESGVAEASKYYDNIYSIKLLIRIKRSISTRSEAATSWMSLNHIWAPTQTKTFGECFISHTCHT